MTEAEAKALLDVSRETIDRLEAFTIRLSEENLRQNLVSQRSLATVWSRHILDSAQLARHAPVEARTWLDLGSGAGFPGLIVPLVHQARITLVESRPLRVQFLAQAAKALGVDQRVDIVGARVERVATRAFDVISARAFAPLEKLLSVAERFSTSETVWILPKGRNAKSELEAVRASWQGDFRLEPSLTDPDARIIVARRVSRKPRER